MFGFALKRLSNDMEFTILSTSERECVIGDSPCLCPTAVNALVRDVEKAENNLIGVRKPMGLISRPNS
jgi:hypothetical protein